MRGKSKQGVIDRRGASPARLVALEKVCVKLCVVTDTNVIDLHMI